MRCVNLHEDTIKILGNCRGILDGIFMFTHLIPQIAEYFNGILHEDTIKILGNLWYFRCVNLMKIPLKYSYQFVV